MEKKAFCKEYDRRVDYDQAQLYLREYQKQAKERGEGIFLPEVMEKYRQYRKRRDEAIERLVRRDMNKTK